MGGEGWRFYRGREEASDMFMSYRGQEGKGAENTAPSPCQAFT